MVDDQPWDEEFARTLLGKTLLVGLTFLDSKGDRVEQFYGEVVSADSRRGIELCLAGQRAGEVYWLPPDVRSILAAPSGLYTLRASGEVVENPDFTATWGIHPRKTDAE